MTTDALRKRLKSYYLQCEQINASHQEKGCSDGMPELPVFPEECHGMTCGAKTRGDAPCKRTDLHKNGRCKLHGGLSTGPKTLEGKRRSALNTGKTYEELIRAKSKRP